MSIDNLFIPKTIQVIDDCNSINLDEIFEKLPEKFVMKCNHGSGHVFICEDKNNFDFIEKIKILANDLKVDYSHSLLEYHYSFIKPVILIEEYLSDSSTTIPIDYKFFSFNGKTKCVMVCTDRTCNGYDATFYDYNWKKLNFSTHESSKKIIKPNNFSKMWEISEKLSKGHKFVRVDLYNIDGKIYFSELTFTPAAGMSNTYTEKADVILGNYLDL